MKLVSFERECSLDDENHNDRCFCWWVQFTVSFKVGRGERARMSVGRLGTGNGCELAAEVPSV